MKCPKPRVVLEGTFPSAYNLMVTLEKLMKMELPEDVRDDILALKTQLRYSMDDYKESVSSLNEMTDEEVIEFHILYG